MVAFIDITGKRFHRWLVLEKIGSTNKKIFWKCLCDCGNIRSVSGSSLKVGHTKSCGCYNLEEIIKRETTHGMTGHPLHNIWKGIHNRCRNHNDRAFRNYGGRGIKVCERWENFQKFYDDMFPSWIIGLTIDRIDCDGNYELSNCRWISRSEQSKNRRCADQWGFKKSPISTNTSGIRGVSWCVRDQKWMANICVNRKQKNIGRFVSKEDAKAAYDNAALELRKNDKNTVVGGGI